MLHGMLAAAVLTVLIADSLQRMMEAVNRADAAGYAEIYAADAVIHIQGTGTLRGRAAIEAHEVQLLRQFPRARFAIADLWIVDASTAFARYAVRAPLAQDRVMGHEGLLFFRFDESGQIVEERRYLDSLTPMLQVRGDGAAAPPPSAPPLAQSMRVHRPGRSRSTAANMARVRSFLAGEGERSIASAPRIEESLLPGRPFQGTAALAQWRDLWAHSVPDARFTVRSMHAAGEAVLVEGVLEGTLQEDFGLADATGKRFTAARALLFELKGAKIHTIRAFMNGRQLKAP